MPDDYTLVQIVAKNTLEEVHVSLSEFKGAHLLDVRIYADFDGSRGEKKATKKGVAIKVEKLPEMIEALQAAQRIAEARGLLSAVSEQKPSSEVRQSKRIFRGEAIPAGVVGDDTSFGAEPG